MWRLSKKTNFSNALLYESNFLHSYPLDAFLSVNETRFCLETETNLKQNSLKSSKRSVNYFQKESKNFETFEIFFKNFQAFSSWFRQSFWTKAIKILPLDNENKSVPNRDQEIFSSILSPGPWMFCCWNQFRRQHSSTSAAISIVFTLQELEPTQHAL